LNGEISFCHSIVSLQYTWAIIKSNQIKSV